METRVEFAGTFPSYERCLLPALVVFIRHLTRSLLRADGLSEALGRLRRGRRNYCDDPVDRFARPPPGLDPPPAGIGEKIVVGCPPPAGRPEGHAPLRPRARPRY